MFLVGKTTDVNFISTYLNVSHCRAQASSPYECAWAVSLTQDQWGLGNSQKSLNFLTL